MIIATNRRVYHKVTGVGYNLTTRKSIHEMMQLLKNLWKMNSSLCPLEFSTKFNTTVDPFNLNWMLEKLKNEINETKIEVEQIREESTSFLTKQMLIVEERNAQPTQEQLFWHELAVWWRNPTRQNDCTQMLFSNQQLNFKIDTVSSFRYTLYADTKSYRAALYKYKLNLLTSIPILLSNRLPMSCTMLVTQGDI